MKFTVTTLLLITAFAANAGSFEDYARVISVQERYSSTGQRRQVCNNSGSSNQESSSNFGVGTAVGAVAGGLLGAQVGKGNGRTAAAAVGAVTGALVGNHVSSNNNSNPSGSQNCYMTDGDTRISGYSVTYEYNGRSFTDVFPTAPRGDSIKVRVSLMATSGN